MRVGSFPKWEPLMCQDSALDFTTPPLQMQLFKQMEPFLFRIIFFSNEMQSIAQAARTTCQQCSCFSCTSIVHVNPPKTLPAKLNRGKVYIGYTFAVQHWRFTHQPPVQFPFNFSISDSNCIFHNIPSFSPSAWIFQNFHKYEIHSQIQNTHIYISYGILFLEKNAIQNNIL